MRDGTALCTLSLLVLAGCVSSHTAPMASLAVPPFAGARLGDDDRDLPDPASFLAVDPAMRNYAAEVLAPIANPKERLRRIAVDLIEPGGRYGIEYREDLTLPASEVFRRREGNCLSFTALVVQLVRATGLPARFEDVPVLPKWRVAAGAFVVERHVDAFVPLGATDAVIDFHPPDAAAFSRSRLIEDTNATAQYFGNLGVERFTAGDLEVAYRLFRRGLQVDPRVTQLWVNLGVVFGRNGQWADAEHAYRAALSIEPGDLSALNNLALALEKQGDPAGGARLRERVESARRHDPYYLYWLGERALQQGDAVTAADHFAKAIRLLPKDADFHFALARSYLALGRTREAERSLDEALRRAQTPGIRARYRAQYAAASASLAPELP